MNHTKSKMSVFQMTVITVINMMGSGIVLLPSKLAEVGTISILSWIVTAGGSTALAYVLAKCGTFSRKEGGMGGYAEYSFGKTGNFLSNYSYSISILIANVAIALSMVGYASVLFNMELSPVTMALCTILALWAAAMMNAWGARLTGRFSSFAIIGVLVPVLGLSLFGWFWFDPQMYVSSWNPHEYPLGEAVSMSISITLWSFLGLESACVNMDSIDNPERNIPIAVLCGTLATAAIYIASTSAVAGIVPQEALVNSTAPFGLAFATLFGDTAGKIITGLIVLANFGSLLAWQFTIARLFCSSARVGYFPSIFQRVTSSDVPLQGMMILCCIESAMVMMTVTPTLMAQFEILVNLAVITNLAPYLLAAAAAATILKQAGAGSRQRAVMNVAVFITFAYNLYAAYTAGAMSILSGSGMILAGLIVYSIVNRKKLSVSTVR